MKRRGRGRPGKDAADMELVRAVHDAKSRRLTVAQACKEFHTLHGGKVGTIEQLQRRYERINREYFPWEPWSHPRLMVMHRVLGLAPTWVRNRSSAFILLAGRPHKKRKT